MADEEKFVSRWSRLKREAVAAPVPAVGNALPEAVVELPPVESLGFDSDFTGFLDAKVDEKLKQAALKKLFHSPQFNVMDGLDVYIDDYNTFEPISCEMLSELNHAQDLLFRQDHERRAVVPASGGEGGDLPAQPPTIEVVSESPAIEPVDPVSADELSVRQAVPPSETDNQG